MARRATRRRPPEQVRYNNGPWKGVETTTDPFDSGPDTLVDASNGYIPDVTAGSGWYARPGFDLFNQGDPVHTSASTFRGQGSITHTDLSNVTTNFVVFEGKLYRPDATFGAFEDVTPVGITIDPSITTRVYGTSFANQLAITDGVNKPWLATNLTASPITGTDIEFNDDSDDWSAFGPGRLYAGSLIWILNEVDGVAARTDIAWSTAGDITVGYQQGDFDYRWTLGQTDADPLYAIWGDNVALYYFREFSIGAIQGTPESNFQSSHTDDSVSKNVGTLSPQSLVGYGRTLYFTDALGRPYRLQPGAEPEPIWLQMRGIVAEQTVGFSGVTKRTITAAYEATMTAYVVMVYSPIPSQQCPAVEGYIFDTRTGTYFGRFSIADGVQIDTLGEFKDGNGRSIMVALGSLDAPTDSAVAASGYVWGIRSLEAIGDFVTTEDGEFLTTEDDVLLTSEGSENANWMDGDVVPEIFATTPRFGYEIDKVISVDRVGVLTAGDAVCQVSALTAAVAQTVEGSPTPSATEDGTGRLTCGFTGIQGRGITITVQPTTAQTQFQLQQVSVSGVLNTSAPDEG